MFNKIMNDTLINFFEFTIFNLLKLKWKVK
jgi:hypothetical protein